MNLVIEFWSKTGTAAFPDGTTVPFWGFTQYPEGEPQLPGPTIEARAGDNIQLILHNTLPEAVSIVFPGQEFTPEPVKDEKGVFVSFNRYAPPNGGTAAYSFRAERPGTYLYESGTFPEKQVQMGLYGVMIIRPADYSPLTPSGKTAYGQGTGTEYSTERILVTAEIDSSLHSAIAGGLPLEMYQFSPDYFTLNGRAYPDTLGPQGVLSQPYDAVVKTIIGKKTLIRCANAGFLSHSLHITEGYFKVVGSDGRALKTHSLDATYDATTINIAPGQTYDLVYTAGKVGEVYLFDREIRHTVNSGIYPGGIMTCIRAASGPPERPENLSATVLPGASVKLIWSHPSGGDCQFIIERRKGVSGSFSKIATVPAGSGEYTDNSVAVSTIYSYRVYAFSDYGESGYSKVVTVRTAPAPPLSPTNLKARRLPNSLVHLSWTGNSRDELGYIIERRSDSEPYFSEIGNILRTTQYFDTPPSDEIQHYRVRAYNNGGVTGYSNIVSI